MNKKRVLHVITRFVKGGADENTLLTVQGLDKSRYEVHLAVGTGCSSVMIEKATAAGVKVFVVPLEHFNAASYATALFSLYKLMTANDYDIVHTHETEAGIVGRIAAKLAGVKNIVHTVHGIAYTHHRPSWLNNLIIIAEKSTAAFTKIIITNSSSITEDYLKNGIGCREKYTTIYSGINLNDYSHIRKQKQKKFTIAMIARFARGKGHRDLLNAAAALKDKLDFKIIFAGSGELLDEVNAEAARLGLQDRVTFLGEVENSAKVLSMADVVVLPSYWEGTPRVIFEAMTAKVPVIATPVGGIPEIIKHGFNGILVQPGNIQEIANALRSLASGKRLAAKLAENAFSGIHRYSHIKLVLSVAAVYERLLNRLM